MKMAKDFLRDFLEDPRAYGKSDRQKFSIVTDKFDRQYHDSVAKDMKEFENARQELVDFAPDVGYEAFADLFFSLFKAIPKQHDSKDMEASHLVNHSLFGEVLELGEWESLHQYSAADIIAAGMAAISMEPKIEQMMDRMSVERQLAEELREKMKEFLKSLQELEAIKVLMSNDEEDGDEDGDEDGEEDSEGKGGGGGEEEGEGFQDQVDKIEEQMRLLEEEMKEIADSLDTGLAGALPAALSMMQEALQDATGEAEALENASITWGLGAGGLKKIPVERRLQIANMLNNPRLQRIFELMGRFERVYWAEQKRRTNHAKDEIYDIEHGNDIKRVIPSMLARLAGDETLQLDFLYRYINRRLPQWKMRGVEKVAKGGIYACEDGSGSMYGEPEEWAKAICLTGLRLANAQNRSFYGIHFGGTNEIKEFDFSKAHSGGHSGGDVKTLHRGVEETMPFFEGVMNFAETSFNSSGTDFVTPLSKALSLLQAEHDKYGAVDGDILFITDGHAGVSEEWLKEFKSEQERLGFAVFGVLIDIGAWSSGGREPQEPLTSICDQIYRVKDFASADDIRSMFGEI